MPLPTMVTPEKFIKSQIENTLQLDGEYHFGTKALENIVDAIFKAVFNKATRASVQQCLLDIEEDK